MMLPFYANDFYPAFAKRGVAESRTRTLAGLLMRSAFARTHLTDAHGAPWRPRRYQIRSLESRAPRKVHCDGRDVGKTAEIEIVACWAALLRPCRQMLIATQCENHLFPLMERLARRFLATPALSAHLVEIRRSPSWYVRFDNGFVLWGRIAGPHGMNFQGLHVDWQIVDEAQELTETAWGELYQAPNAGGARWVCGVPNGLRNPFFRLTQMPTVESHNWPSSFNPQFSPVKDAELARLYGGKDSPGYIHRVLGQHGSPMHAVFNIDDYLACVDDALDFLNVCLKEGEPFDPPDAPRAEYYLGCDLGYARDPSEFVIYRSDPPHLVNVARIHLEGVNYARQQDVIVQLDRVYAFRGIGIDAGNNGRAVAHNLMNLGCLWCDKVHAFEFGGITDLGEMPNGSPDRRPTKALMTELIQRHMLDRSIVFPRLPDRESQYASHTYAVGQMGRILFDKGDDHLIDADRCAVLAHHLETFVYFNPRPRMPLLFETF